MMEESSHNTSKSHKSEKDDFIGESKDIVNNLELDLEQNITQNYALKNSQTQPTLI